MIVLAMKIEDWPKIARPARATKVKAFMRLSLWEKIETFNFNDSKLVIASKFIVKITELSF